MIKQFHANQARLRRHQRIRRHLEGSELRPRLNVFRSGQHIYAQIIDDTTGKTLVSASTLDESLRDFKPVSTEQHKQAAKTESAPVAVEEVVEEAAPAKGKKAAKGGRAAAAVAEAPKKEKKSQTEKLAGILSNRKVSLAHEVGKLVAQRAQEKGVKQVVFDRGGYAYHGRVAALAEGAREAGLDF
jgi:large subunit ribosomal protein L18